MKYSVIITYRDREKHLSQLLYEVYTLDEETIRFPNKNDYDKFKMKHNL